MGIVAPLRRTVRLTVSFCSSAGAGARWTRGSLPPSSKATLGGAPGACALSARPGANTPFSGGPSPPREGADPCPDSADLTAAASLGSTAALEACSAPASAWAGRGFFSSAQPALANVRPSATSSVGGRIEERGSAFIGPTM